MAEDDKSDIKIKIGAEMQALVAAVSKTLSFIKLKYAATFLAVKKIMEKVAETKLNAVLKQQQETFGSLSTTLDVINRKYDITIRKMERMANAAKQQSSAELQRISAFRAINAARYEMWRKEALVPGMTPREMFAKNAEIDAKQRQADLNDARKEQEIKEDDSRRAINDITNKISANAERRQKLERLSRMVNIAQTAIPDAELADTDLLSIVTGKKGNIKNNINQLFGKSFGTGFNVNTFWDDPQIQGFRGRFGDLQKQIRDQIREAIDYGQDLQNDLKAAQDTYRNTADIGRAQLVGMMKDNMIEKAKADREFAYESGISNARRGRYLSDRDRTVSLADRELGWARRMETASWKEQIAITKERERFYRNLVADEEKLLKRYAGKKEEDLNDEQKAIRSEIESRRNSYQDTLRSIGEFARVLAKSSGDAAEYTFKAGWNDIRESRMEANRELGMQGASSGIRAMVNGDHWLSQHKRAQTRLDAIATKYGAKRDKDGNIDYRTMDFRALRNNEYDSARFDRLQGKVETYRANMSSSATDIIRYRQDLASRNVEALKNSNRLTDMGLGGGETISFTRQTADNTREANKLLSQILSALGADNGAVNGTWGM